MTPVFIFSLPRAGSTLLQRMLSKSGEISTVNEPWILLPLLYALKEEGAYSEYNHRVMCYAIDDFCNKMPNGKEDYLSEVHDLVLNLYKKASAQSTRYFLDKTPRYHVVSGTIMDMFPEGKFIFLWRNPLAIIASIIDTWGRGKWNVYISHIDLYAGLEELIEVFKKNRNNACVVHYEDLLKQPVAELEKLSSYLSLELGQEPLSLSQDDELRGKMGRDRSMKMGDPSGAVKYKEISDEPLSKWKRTLSSPIRKAWCRRYLKWIGPDRLKIMGYDYDVLMKELDEIPLSFDHLFSDCARIVGSVVYSLCEPIIFRDKVRRMMRCRRNYAHR